MAVRTARNISLTAELEQFVTAQVATGRYKSASEVVREALRLLEQTTPRLDAARASSSAGTTDRSAGTAGGR